MTSSAVFRARLPSSPGSPPRAHGPSALSPLDHPRAVEAAPVRSSRALLVARFARWAPFSPESLRAHRRPGRAVRSSLRVPPAPLPVVGRAIDHPDAAAGPSLVGPTDGPGRFSFRRCFRFGSVVPVFLRARVSSALVSPPRAR